MEAKPLIAIVGPTASGKTALSIRIAQRYGGEIICADSRTIYKGMDIGTAKPTSEEQALVPHWGIDLATPSQRFTAADFKRYADQKAAEIRHRGHIPMLVGGTGLYVDSVLFDYQFGPKANESLRDKFDQMSLDELHNYCIENNIELPKNSNNKRYIVRSIEQNGINSARKNEPISNSFIVGITTDRIILRHRIEKRAQDLLQNGVIDEAKKLAETYGWDNEAMTGNIYPLCRKYLEGTITKDELLDKFITLDWRLAKRQLTWLKRDQFITWLSLDDAEQYIASRLAS